MDYQLSLKHKCLYSLKWQFLDMKNNQCNLSAKLKWTAFNFYVISFIHSTVSNRNDHNYKSFEKLGLKMEVCI